MSDGPERGLEIDRENLIENGVGIVLDRRERAADPGVEEQSVDRAVVRDGRIERGDPLRLVGNVGGEGGCKRTDCNLRLCQLLGTTGDQRDFAATRRDQLRRRPARSRSIRR